MKTDVTACFNVLTQHLPADHGKPQKNLSQDHENEAEVPSIQPQDSVNATRMFSLIKKEAEMI